MSAFKTFPALRTVPVATLNITWWSCLIGYAVTLLGIPLLAVGLTEIATLTLKGSGITYTPIGPALKAIEDLVSLLSISVIASWTGAILSVPVVIWARAKGWFGWGTAMLTGISVGIISLTFLYGFGLEETLIVFSIPNALLGLAFWISVRLIHPSAFQPTL